VSGSGVPCGQSKASVDARLDTGVDGRQGDGGLCAGRGDLNPALAGSEGGVAAHLEAERPSVEPEGALLVTDGKQCGPG